jgi:hypothetical protein
MGERTPLACSTRRLPGRMAVGEALTNIAAAVSRSWATSSCRPTGWRRRVRRARMRACSIPCAPSPTCASRSACRSRSARIRCRCARLGRGGREETGGFAAVADRHRLRAGADDAPHADAATQTRCRRNRPAADRPRHGQEPPRRFGAGAGVQRDRAIAPDVDDPARLPAFFGAMQQLAPPIICCSPITTAPTAACSPPSAKWLCRALRRFARHGRPLLRPADATSMATRRSPHLLAAAPSNSDARAVQRGTRRRGADSPQRSLAW